MPFIIDPEKCAGCGTCIGNCPNRAIVRRGDSVYITVMCSDCGICVQHCGMNAIVPGTEKAEFDVKKLDVSLKKNLSLKKNIVAIKYADSVPVGITEEKGLSFWCHACGEVFAGEADPLFFTAKNSTCAGASNLGLGTRETGKEEYNLMIKSMILGDGGYYASKELLTIGRKMFPKFNKVYAGMVIGSLSKVEMPDVVLIPVNGKQMCMLSTAYSFDTGEIIDGKAGGGTCLGTIPISFLENRPVFSCGDYGGRLHMRLGDEEIIAAFPFKLLSGVVRNLKRTVFNQEK
jgi:uncharacterized protein (DUF169 family)/NAD-dependent dihydropyrimidine dehydrogenase PreA subunit